MYYLKERSPVDRGHSFFADRGVMILCAVALMLCKAVSGINFIIFHHHVARIEAAAIESDFASPLIIGITSRPVPLKLTASIRRISGD